MEALGSCEDAVGDHGMANGQHVMTAASELEIQAPRVNDRGGSRLTKNGC